MGRVWPCAGAAALALVACSSAQAQWRNVWSTQSDTGEGLTEVDIDIAIDSQGNAVTVGWIVDPSTDYNMLMRKYDRTGRLLWTRTYDGAGHGYDGFFSLVIDSNDNILTSGVGDNANGNSDIVTLKYSPDGQLLWDNYYDGPLGGRDESYGWPAIGLDAADNPYVCGYSQAIDGVYEAVTIKYDSAGNEQWVQRYRGPNATYPNTYAWALSVTAGGDVYVGGDSYNLDNNGDYLALKYDTDGNLLWDRMVDSDYHGWESVYSIAVDVNENVFLIGISDSLYLNNDFEYCVAKFTSDGVYQWQGRYGGNYGFHYGWVGEPDDVGGVYVTGATMSSGGQYDVGTVHFDASGATHWARIYNSPQWFGDDWGYYITRDLDGNVLVAGYGWNGHGAGNNAYLLKYSPAGTLLDEVNYDGELHADDWFVAVAVDDANRAVVAGFSTGLGSAADSYVAKYTTAPPPQLVIDPDPLVGRRNATFTVTDFEPGSDCFLAYSVQGTSSFFVPPLNVTLSLRSPRQAGGVAVSNSAGSAAWTLRIPNVPGANVWFQAAQYNQVSNVVATQVQ